jgi:TonB family protein
LGRYEMAAGSGRFRINISKIGYDALSTVSFEIKLGEPQIRHHFLAPASTRSPQVTAGCPEPMIGAEGGRVKSAKILRQVDPVYPKALRARRLAGHVVIETVLDKQGRPSTLRPLLSPDGELTEAAERAVQKWRYTPVLFNDSPVDVVFPITLSFVP